MSIIQTENLTKIYGTGETAVVALDHVESQDRPGRIRRRHGTQRLRQIHPAAPAGRAGPSQRRKRRASTAYAHRQR